MNGLLLCFAHPDDESVLAAGMACGLAAAGVPVTLIVATRGEAGKAGNPPVCTPEELPEVREAELREAARTIGIHDIHLLGYRDRELASAPHEAVREQMVALLRRYRPQVVLTFDPNGSNRHPDHIAISRFTSDAIAAAADDRWCPALGAAHHVSRLLWSPPQSPWHMMRQAGFPDLAGVDFVVDIRKWSQQKAAALRAHRTQHLSMERIFFSQPDVERLLSMEIFRQAWGPALRARPSGDIFSGL